MLGRAEGIGSRAQSLVPRHQEVEVSQWRATFSLEVFGVSATRILPGCTDPCYVASKPYPVAF